MGMDITSYVVYGKVMPKAEFEALEHGLEEMSQNELSCFIASEADFERYVLVGFCLTANNGYASIPFAEVNEGTPGMQTELEEFFTKHHIAFKTEDFKSYVFSYMSI